MDGGKQSSVHMASILATDVPDMRAISRTSTPDIGTSLIQWLRNE
jgi:hypothetical protein